MEPKAPVIASRELARQCFRFANAAADGELLDLDPATNVILRELNGEPSSLSEVLPHSTWIAICGILIFEAARDHPGKSEALWLGAWSWLRSIALQYQKNGAEPFDAWRKATHWLASEGLSPRGRAVCYEKGKK